MPVFTFEHWKGNANGALTKVAKTTTDPLVAFKSFIGSKTRNHDMINVESSYELYVDPHFTMFNLIGWQEDYGLPYAYSKFLETCDIDRFYAQIPMNGDLSKYKKAPLKE